jgi:hypothetical protein
MSTARCILLFGMLVQCFCVALSAPPTQKEQEQIADAMNVNFEACNKEDIDLVMKSVADAMPGRDRFRDETVATFKQKDIHYSLVECEVLDVQLPWAKARIVQDTLVLDRQSADVDQAKYRNSSALLPQGERVEYINTFKKENGRWKLYLIVSEMKPVKADARP